MIREKVILTGGTGFIGRYILEELVHQGYEVHCLTHSKAVHLNNESVFSHKVNLLSCEEKELEALLLKINASVIFHSAWYTNNKDYLTASTNYEWLSASKRLIHTFYKTGGAKFIGLGSCIEYDFSIITKERNFLEENDALGSQKLYGQCKIALSEYLKEVSSLEHKDYLWARVFFVYGPHDRPGRLIPYIVNQLSQDKYAEPYYGGACRDYIFVKDLAKQIVHLHKAGGHGIINTGTGKGEKIKTIFQNVGKILGKEHLIVTNDKLATDKKNEPEFVIAKLREGVEWPRLHTLVEGIRETIEWMTINEETIQPIDITK